MPRDGAIIFADLIGTPVYAEYNMGHYARSRLSSKIDQSKISAEIKDGVVSLILPKIKEAKSRSSSEVD
jgi:HSP20 family molecular chaperone IbpA